MQLIDLTQRDFVKWHISHRFNCWVLQGYFYIGTLLTKITFLMKLRIEAYMCKALASLQLNHNRTTRVKIFKFKSKLRIFQISQRQSIFLVLYWFNWQVKKVFMHKEKGCISDPFWHECCWILGWALCTSPHPPWQQNPAPGQLLKKPFWKTAFKMCL